MEAPPSPETPSRSPRLSPRLIEDFHKVNPPWDQEFEQLTRSMQDRMDDFFRSTSPLPQQTLQPPPLPGLSGASSGGNRGRFENQQDGSILYKMSFDVHGYEPTDLKTTLIGDRTVRVCGSTNRSDPRTGKQTSASFDEQFTLPDNVDPGKLRSTIVNDQLTISAPVLPPQYPAVTGAAKPTLQQPPVQQQRTTSAARQAFTGSPRLTPRSMSPMPQQQQLQQQQQQQQSGVRTVSSYQLEVDVGREFDPQDLTVATTDGGRRLTVHGRREVKASGKTSMREFRDEFDLPANVDAGRVTARLRSDGRVVVDMPLLRETAGFTYWPVAVEHRQ